MEMNQEVLYIHHFPAFGNWDASGDMPITQYFESARHAGLYARKLHHEPALPPWDNQYSPLPPQTFYHVTHKGNGTQKRFRSAKEMKKPSRICDVALELPSPPTQSKRTPKAIDADLYEIPPELLRRNRRHKLFNLFSRIIRLRFVCY